MNTVKNRSTKRYYFKDVPSAIGGLRLVASDDGLAAVLWEKEKTDAKRVPLNVVGEDNDHPILVQTERELGEYFSGQRKKFDVEMDFAGTDFQNKVWEALLSIPFGETRTYGEIARQIGNPKGVRAVGGASNKNPIAIIAPCHRVVGASGDLTGFAGGLKVKEQLLALEGLKGFGHAATA
jgi:methylated-DNA-[protein]-cysteine S-methyltransferase